MPGPEEELKVKITGEDQLSPVLDRVQGRAEGMSARLKKAGEAASRGMMILGGAATAMAGLSVKAATDFESSMTRALMMFGDIAQEQRENLSSLARTIAVETGTSATQAAEALWFLGSAGMEASEAGKALGDIMKVVAARGIDVTAMGELAMTSMQVFGYGAQDTARVLNVLAGAEAASLINLDDLRESFVYAAPTAAQLGMSIEETAATIAALGKAGVKGSIAGTALARVMEGMLDPTDEARAMFEQLGISIWQQDGTMRSVVEIIKDIGVATQGMTDQQKAMVSTTLFGTRELRAFNAITSVGTDFINQLSASLATSNNVQQQWNDWTQTNAFRMGQLKAKLEETAISLGEKLIPVLVPLIENFSKILEKLTPLIEKHGDLIAKVLLVTAALLPLGIALKTVIGTVSMLAAILPVLTGPFGIAIALIAGLAAVGFLVWKNWDAITAALGKIWESIKETAVRVFNAIKDFFVTWGPTILAVLLGPLGLLGKFIFDNWEAIKTKTIEVWNGMVGFFASIPSRIGQALSTLKDFLLAPFRAAFNAIIRGANFLIDQLNRISVSIPSWVPGLGGKSFGISLPRLPEWQHGGLITEPTVLYGLQSRRPYAIAGERGPEQVGPGASIVNNFNISQLVVREEADIQRIARQLFALQQTAFRATGVR